MLEELQRKRRSWTAIGTRLNTRKRQKESGVDPGEDAIASPDITEYRKTLIKQMKEHKPKLVMDEPSYLDHLEMTINGSRMSWLYNALGTIFNGVVRTQIEEEVSKSLVEKSNELLDPSILARSTGQRWGPPIHTSLGAPRQPTACPSMSRTSPSRKRSSASQARPGT